MALNFAQKEFEIDRLLAEKDCQKAVELLETWLSSAQDFSEIAEIARSLSEVQLGLQPESKKAFQYAQLAGENFIRSGRAAPAIALLTWMRKFPQAFDHYEALERLVVLSYSRSNLRKKKKTDDNLPPPTPFQEISASPSVYSFGEESLNRFQLREISSQSFPLLSSLKASEIARLLRLAEHICFADSENIFVEGSEPTGFYVLTRGQVELRSSSGFIKVLKEGDFVGDISLFGGMFHSSTAVAHGRCELIYFSDHALKECFDHVPRLKEEVLDHFYRRLFKNTGHQSIVFGCLDDDEMTKAWEYFVPIHVPAGRVIMEPNRLSDRMFLILKGKIEVLKYGEAPIFLGPGHFVGERGLVLQTMRTATLTTVSDCQLLECDLWSFEELCEDFPKIARSLDQKRSELEKFVFNSKNLVVD